MRQPPTNGTPRARWRLVALMQKVAETESA